LATRAGSGTAPSTRAAISAVSQEGVAVAPKPVSRA
jgi:hypothetical protein